MYDLLDLLHIDTKEDIYTFCLEEFLKKSECFREKSKTWWGFTSSDFSICRKAIELDECTDGNRSKIVPDLILYNDEQISVIESKMFSSEGYNQTVDYEKSKMNIIEFLRREHCKKCEAASVSFYFFTLAGVPAKSSYFETRRWAEYYAATLDGVQFEDLGLEALGRAIYQRAKSYLDFIKNYSRKPYEDVVNNHNTWIAPYSLFSRGLLDSNWKLDPEIYGLYNGKVTGNGHSTFRTDIYKKNKQCLKGQRAEDNIWIFTRIEWKEKSVDIVINMEYWLVKKGIWENYIPNKMLPAEIRKNERLNRNVFCKYLEERVLGEHTDLRIPRRAENMLHMLIKSIETEGKTLGEIVDAISEYLALFEKIKDAVIENTRLESGFWTIEL
ncbi:MAG: hypothetical protein E7300_08670 [Lachnospiraceae bacterium]|nr:hypothetical protein [Lachnospiraceae bacterium]